ncbi:phage tail protein, partial [Halodesulfovibrio aestuarii]|uniref:phage tail protein n=1 Tax=Halodesulfovibrio aestuarii TaxID=126333 RepID=UPI00352024BD
MPDFYTVVTDTGLQALGLASTQGQSFSLTHAIVGDGNGLAVIPNKGMTALVNEVWRGEVAGVKVDSDDPNTFIFEFAIPADTGGFTIREVGLLDKSGKLFCVGNFPDTEKPVAVNGSVRDLVVRLPLHFENADEVNLVIDTTVAIATKQDVLDHNADPLAHRLATTAQTGFVRLATDEEHVA